jgi:tRNA threonylcarbamoyladenosine biosynthesis protein TsaE
MSPVFGQDTLDFISHSEAQTLRFGVLLATLLHPGDVLALTGELGTGKTRWIQGVCRGLEVIDPVTSPTFTLVNEYQGRCPVYHIDLYRLDQSSEVLSFGLDDYLYGNGISLIEWAERAGNFLPAEYLSLEIYHLEYTKRRLVMNAIGQRFGRVLVSFKEIAFSQLRQL